MKDASFFDEPVGLTLGPFAGFGFSSVTSWAEIELYATACGSDTDGNFLNVLCAASWWFDNLHTAILAELSVPDCQLPAANSVRFVECLFKVWASYVPRRPVPLVEGPVDEFYRWGVGVGLDLKWPDRDSNNVASRKYGLLSALDEKFPYLLVKFYALHAKDLRRDDMKFVSWLRARLERRVGSDPHLAPVLAAMDAEAKEMDRTAMYMR